MVSCKEHDFEQSIARALDSLIGMGFNVVLKHEQRQAIVHLLCDKDVIAILPTRFGKSLIFIVYVP